MKNLLALDKKLTAHYMKNMGLAKKPPEEINSWSDNIKRKPRVASKQKRGKV